MPRLSELPGCSALAELLDEVDAILDEPVPLVVVPEAYAAQLDGDVPECHPVPLTDEEMSADRRRRDIEGLMRHNGGGSLGSEV